jgi:hypothetical protein
MHGQGWRSDEIVHVAIKATAERESATQRKETALENRFKTRMMKLGFYIQNKLMLSGFESTPPHFVLLTLLRKPFTNRLGESRLKLLGVPDPLKKLFE